MTTLVLYAHVPSPSCQRVFATLAYKNLDYEIVAIDISKKERPDDFIRIAPFGRVPVLVVDGKFVLWESNVINEYLEEIYPQKPLLPKGHSERADIRRWIRFSDEKMSELLDPVIYVAEKNKKIEIALSYLKNLAFLDRTLAHRGRYFMGDELTLADIALAAPLNDTLVWPELLKYSDWEKYTHLHKYLEELKRHPILQDAIFNKVPANDMLNFWSAVLKEGLTLEKPTIDQILAKPFEI
jgi:glutathione S-transferase